MQSSDFVQVNIGSHMRKAKPIGFLVASDGCWLWQGYRDEKGYGIWNQRKAHRVMYERLIGPIPEGLVLDHLVCSNKSCVNPLHLKPVTSRENTLRGDTLAARQLARTHCIHGHPLVAGNLRANKSEPRKRRCLTCKRIASTRAYTARKAGP